MTESGCRNPTSTVTELLAAYMRHAEQYYTKAGKPTSQVHIVRAVVRFWREAFGAILVRKVKPTLLKAVQKRMVGDGQSRCYVNKVTTARGSRCSAGAVENESGRRLKSGTGFWPSVVWRRDAPRLGRLPPAGTASEGDVDRGS